MKSAQDFWSSLEVRESLTALTWSGAIYLAQTSIEAPRAITPCGELRCPVSSVARTPHNSQQQCKFRHPWVTARSVQPTSAAGSESGQHKHVGTRQCAEAPNKPPVCRPDNLHCRVEYLQSTQTGSLKVCTVLRCKADYLYSSWFWACSLTAHINIAEQKYRREHHRSFQQQLLS